MNNHHWTPPKNRKEITITYKGANYTLEELSRHPDCEVPYRKISARIVDYGIEPEIAIKKNIPHNYPFIDKLITAFGETKTIKEWSNDPRCLITYRKLRDRIFKYEIEPELALQYEDKLNHCKSKCQLTPKEIKLRCKNFLNGEYRIIESFSDVYSIDGIYGIFNTETGKLYVGQASGLKGIYGRIATHQRMLQENNHDNSHLQQSWNKYGEHAFAFIVLEDLTNNTSEITQREGYWVAKYNTKNNDFGYNINDPETGRAGIITRPLSVEQIKLWVTTWIKEIGEPPQTCDGIIPYDEFKRTWKNIDHNLNMGIGGLKGNQTLRQIVHQITGIPYIKKTLPKGVYWDNDKKSYCANIFINSKTHRIARTNDKEKAIALRKLAEKLITNGASDIVEIRKTVKEQILGFTDGNLARNTSGFAGVIYTKYKTWHVYSPGFGGKHGIFIGSYATCDEAIQTRKQAEAIIATQDSNDVKLKLLADLKKKIT